MTENDWRRVADRIESTWPGAPGAAEAYRDELADLDPDAVEAALDDLLIEYRNEAPPPRVVRRRATAAGPDRGADADGAEGGLVTPPPPQDPTQAPRESRKATLALILGVAGLLAIPVLFSVAAIIVGGRALDEIARTPGLGGERRARFGRVLGWIGLAVMAITILIGVLVSR